MRKLYIILSVIILLSSMPLTAFASEKIDSDRFLFPFAIVDEQKDKKWYSNLLGNENVPCFSIKLVNGEFYKATGIMYDNINHELFDVIES